MSALRIARPEDAAALNTALARLSADIGDLHRGTDATLARALENGTARAVLAEADGVMGAALYSPVLSTIRDASGLYVSDLWVCQTQRGTGLGRRLLAVAARDAAEVWGARFLKLTVYGDNDGAMAFYDRIGFESDPREHPLHLTGAAFETLRNAT